jgi:cytochrome c553
MRRPSFSPEWEQRPDGPCRRPQNTASARAIASPGGGRPRDIVGGVRARWLLVVFGPALILVIGSVLALLFLPHPVPRGAPPPQRLYLAHCAECHGANGHGSWRATLFLLRPTDLADPLGLAPLSDAYLFDLVKHGGAPIGKPGMPAFGYHLSDEQIREVVRYVRSLSRAPAASSR